MPSKRKRNEIDLRIGLGDDLITILKDVNDRETAEKLTAYVWEGVEE